MNLKRFYSLLITFSIVFLVSCFYYFNNPKESKYTLGCAFKESTGLECTGCGGQRSFYYLVHGDLKNSLTNNALLLLFLVLLIYFVFYIIDVGIFKNKINDNFIFNKTFGIGFLIIIVLFTVLRNIPYYPFNLLAPHWFKVYICKELI